MARMPITPATMAATTDAIRLGLLDTASLPSLDMFMVFLGMLMGAPAAPAGHRNAGANGG